MSNPYLAAIATTILHLHPPQLPPFFFTSRHNSTILCYYHILWFYFSWRQQFLHILIRPFHPRQQPQFDQSSTISPTSKSVGQLRRFRTQEQPFQSPMGFFFFFLSLFFKAQCSMSNVFNFYFSNSPLNIRPNVKPSYNRLTRLTDALWMAFLWGSLGPLGHCILMWDSKGPFRGLKTMYKQREYAEHL